MPYREERAALPAAAELEAIELETRRGSEVERR